jgi:hypothetical protein
MIIQNNRISSKKIEKKATNKLQVNNYEYISEVHGIDCKLPCCNFIK